VFLTLVALGAAHAVTVTVGHYLPDDEWGRFLSLIVFVYTMEPVFRRTLKPLNPEKSFDKSYWTMSASAVVIATLLDAMVKPPVMLGAVLGGLCIGGPAVVWVVLRMNRPESHR
jgi:hypothetical protein